VIARKDSDHAPHRIPKHISRPQRHHSWETAIERSTETARQRQLRARLVSLLEPIFEEDAIEARSFAKMKDEASKELPL